MNAAARKSTCWRNEVRAKDIADEDQENNQEDKKRTSNRGDENEVSVLRRTKMALIMDKAVVSTTMLLVSPARTLTPPCLSSTQDLASSRPI
jgi:hypothetical protein